ncbi:MAG: hypothetical protein WCA07_04520 [Gloeobacterales cyanobacterium]
MTQSSPGDPKNVPLDAQAIRNLRLALRGLNYDLNTELESFRKWRQQTQKPSNAQTPQLVAVSSEASPAFGKTQNPQTAPKILSLSPLTAVVGAIILISLGSIIWLFTNGGGQRKLTTPAPSQPTSTSKSGSNLKSVTPLPKNSAKPEPSRAIASKPKIQPKPPTQGQPSMTKGVQPVPKPVAAVAAQKKSTRADKPATSSTFQGYGYYYVFVPVNGAKDLSKLKAIAPGAYPRVIDGRTYMQMAAYDSDRRAQIMARQLRQRGYTVEVKK